MSEVPLYSALVEEICGDMVERGERTSAWNLLKHLCFPDSLPSFTCLVISLPGFKPITISQLGFTPSQITTASMSFGVPLPEPESEFPSYPHYPQELGARPFPLERPVETDVYVSFHFCLEEESPPQGAHPSGTSLGPEFSVVISWEADKV